MAREYAYAIRATGLRDFRTALRNIDKRLDAGVGYVYRDAAKQVRERARQNAPRRSGALRSSLRYSVTQRWASVYSKSPYSAVHEYGGTIRPRGGRVKIERARYTGRAIEQSRRVIDAANERVLDTVADLWVSRGGKDV